MGVYPATDLDTMPLEGDIIPIELEPSAGGRQGPTLIPLLPCPAETSVWLFLPSNLKEVQLRSITFCVSGE